MNILITGGAGYIGTELTYQLANDPSIKEIILYDNLNRGNYNLFLGTSKLPTDKISLIRGELLDTRKLKKVVEKADVVFHLAAKVTTPFADHNPHEFDQVNNWGTAELTYLVENCNVAKYIYTSSVSVYGSSNEVAGIKTLPEPRTFYGISKLHGEEHVNRLQNSGTETYILRCGNVYGYSKSMRFDSVINKFIFEANFTGRLKIFGDGNQYRSFIHISRLCSFLGDIAGSNHEPSTYNLVEGTFQINEIVDELRKLYPSLEMVFVNQNMKMRSLKVVPDNRLDKIRQINADQLSTDLKLFRSKFSF